MKSRLCTIAVVLATITVSAQQPQLATSHRPVKSKTAAVAAKPALRVNGAVLTEVDVVRQMYAIFPYAQQHGGVPKDLEPEIRRGAVEMLVFEELLYQEAKRQGRMVSEEKVTRGVATIRRNLGGKAPFDEYLKTECNGSMQVLKEKIRRSFLIETMLKDLDRQSSLTPAEVRAYYDRNASQFVREETYSFQTISFLPPATAAANVHAEAKAKAKSAVNLGRAAKNKEAFGLIAQQISEDDWRMKMGDRGKVPVSKMPPEIAKALRAMKVGEVSDAIQIGPAWVIVRLNGRVAGGKVSFAEAKPKLEFELRKQKRDELRAALNKKLRKDAKVELL